MPSPPTIEQEYPNQYEFGIGWASACRMLERSRAACRALPSRPHSYGPVPGGCAAGVDVIRMDTAKRRVACHDDGTGGEAKILLSRRLYVPVLRSYRSRPGRSSGRDSSAARSSRSRSGPRRPACRGRASHRTSPIPRQRRGRLPILRAAVSVVRPDVWVYRTRRDLADGRRSPRSAARSLPCRDRGSLSSADPSG